LLYLASDFTSADAFIAGNDDLSEIPQKRFAHKRAAPVTSGLPTCLISRLAESGSPARPPYLDTGQLMLG
jgi:hypothetical protein